MDIREYNREAWNKEVEQNNEWTVPVSAEAVAAARRGEWEIVLTPTLPVPKAWFPGLKNLDVLCLASGGGQQGPILAAVGAKVTVFDNSPKQLAQDRFVAERDSLVIDTAEGDMADLSLFDDQQFDLIVHPVSNLFVPDVRPVWHESFRVLRSGGVLLTGFCNPVSYIFDFERMDDEGILEVKYQLPYSDLHSLDAEAKQRYLQGGHPLEFSHTLDEQIGGQLDAGFVLTGFFEDNWGQDAKKEVVLANHMPMFMATRALKL